jgi:hypothetical protein
MTEEEAFFMFGYNPEGGVDIQDVSEITTVYEQLLRRCLDEEFGVENKALRNDIETALKRIGTPWRSITESQWESKPQTSQYYKHHGE